MGTFVFLDSRKLATEAARIRASVFSFEESHRPKTDQA